MTKRGNELDRKKIVGTAVGCLVIYAGISALGSAPVSGEPVAPKTSTPVPSAAGATGDKDLADIALPVDVAETPAKRQGINLTEQAILDAFDDELRSTAQGTRKSGEARDYVAYLINSHGYLCAEPIRAIEDSAHWWGVQCYTHNAGEASANYYVDARQSEVHRL